MSIKWFGAALILAGCGGMGFSMANGIRRQEKLLNQMVHLLGLLESELQYRLTSLPELCTLASKECSGTLREIFRDLSASLSKQENCDAAACMDGILCIHTELPGRLRKHLRHLGHCLGRFDLPGQIQGLKAVRSACQRDLDTMGKNADIHRRSYQTLALCAGTALVILFA